MVLTVKCRGISVLRMAVLCSAMMILQGYGAELADKPAGYDQEAHLQRLMSALSEPERSSLLKQLRGSTADLGKRITTLAKEKQALDRKLDVKFPKTEDGYRKQFELAKRNKEVTEQLAKSQRRRETFQLTAYSVEMLTTIREPGPLSKLDPAQLQAIIETVTPKARPSYVMCENEILETSRVKYWENDLQQFSTKIIKKADSVGRIRCRFNRLTLRCAPNTADNEYIQPSTIGTVFVAADRWMITNHHVVKLFARETKGHWSLEPGVTPVIDFPGEYDGCKTKRNTVTSWIKEIKVHPKLDIAMLQVDGVLPPALPLMTGLSPRMDEIVAVVGYPFGDDPELSREIQDQVFRLTSGEKPMGIRRIQPGMVTEREQQSKIWRYDASTAPGNSGSPVMRIDDGAILGIHFGAFRGVINRFIEVSEVNSFIGEVLSGGSPR